MEQVTQQELHSIAEEKFSIYVGATIDANRRRTEHQRAGISGTMYYASTTNMRQAEDKLLSFGKYAHNRHGESGKEEGDGFVYVIQGKKFN